MKTLSYLFNHLEPQAFTIIFPKESNVVSELGVSITENFKIIISIHMF